MAKISVIVPVYKVEPYLRRCVDSILAQTYRDFELVLVDDGSPDNCGAICDEYATKDKRVAVIRRENGGLSAARNSGLDWVFRNSTSEYIAFIDSDDVVMRQYLEMLYDGIKLGVDIACIGVRRSDSSSLDDGEQLLELIDPEKYWVSDIYHNSSWAKLYKRSLFVDVRYPVGKIYEDEYVTYRLLFKYNKIALCRSRLYVYTVRQGSITNEKWSERRLDTFGGTVGQCIYFYENSKLAALRCALRNIATHADIACHNWNAISEARKVETRCHLRKLRCAWLIPTSQYISVWKIRNPVWGRLLVLLSRVAHRIKRLYK